MDVGGARVCCAVGMIGCETERGIPETEAVAMFSREGRWPGWRLYGWKAWTGGLAGAAADGV